MGVIRVNFLTMAKNHNIEILLTTTDNIEEKHIQQTVEKFLNRLKSTDAVIDGHIIDSQEGYSGLSESERENLRLMVDGVSEEESAVSIMIAEELSEKSD
jgi:ATP/maltotriose-dependent transcriptional regulator MalT